MPGYNADPKILDGDAAKQSLQDFEKNFGVAPGDYIHHMLGQGGGTGSLSELVDGKIPAAKLAEALDASGKLGSDLTKDPNKFAVDLGAGPKKAGTALRDTLKKKLENKDKDEPRGLASLKGPKGASDAPEPHFDGLDPLHEDIFASHDEQEDLTLFDVVHKKYQKLSRMMRPGKVLVPQN